LYLLARCGDESAFLELTQIDITFPENGFFQKSLVVWRQQAGYEGCERAIGILRKFSIAIQSPYKPPKKGRPPQTTQGLVGQYVVKRVESNKPKSEIHRNIAIENLKADEKEINQKTIGNEADRIKKELQKSPLMNSISPRDLAEFMRGEKLSPQAVKALKESSPAEFFTYLSKIYPNS
jgi:hypothetical protein